MKEGKKKLLVIHQSLAPYRIDFWNSLNDLYEMEIYFLYESLPDQPYDQEVLKSKVNFKCHYITNGFIIGSRVVRFGYLSIIKKFKPDIVFTYEYSPATLSIYLIRKLYNYNFEIHSICDDSLRIAATCGGMRKRMRNFLVTKIDKLVVVSNDVAVWYDNNFKLKNKPLFFPIVAREEDFRARLQTSVAQANKFIQEKDLVNKKVILFVGRLVEVKGIDRLMTAFAKVSTENDEAVLVLVGDGDRKETLVNFAKESNLENKVLFVGWQEGNGLLAWYNIGQILVLASYYEPFGAVVNEALLAGATVLCSRTAGASGLVENGVNGSTFDPMNTSELSELLESEIKKLAAVRFIETIRPSKMKTSYDEYFAVFN